MKNHILLGLDVQDSTEYFKLINSKMRDHWRDRRNDETVVLTFKSQFNPYTLSMEGMYKTYHNCKKCTPHYLALLEALKEVRFFSLLTEVYNETN